MAPASPAVPAPEHLRDRFADRLWLWPVVCAAFTAAVHLAFSATPLHIDEAGLALVGRELLATPVDPSSLYGSLWLDRSPVVVALFGFADLLGGDIGVRLIGLVAAIVIVFATAALARELGGRSAVAPASLIAAILTATPTLNAHLSYTELPAAAAGAAGLAVVAPALCGRLVSPRRWLLCGALAMLALLIKQSFIDVLIVGVLVAAISDLRGRRPVATTAFLLGVSMPALATLSWAAAQPLGISGLMYAMFGFRLDAASALVNATSVPFHERLLQLGVSFTAAGLPLLAWPVVRGVKQLSTTRGRATALLAAVWICAACTGVLAGGYYWTHYMVQLAPVVAICAGIGIASLRPARTGHLLIAALAVFMLSASTLAYAATWLNVHQQGPLAVAEVVRANGEPRDTIHAVYARTNAIYYSGATPVFPYQWSLMYRTIPGAEQQAQDLLSSRRRPTWVIMWQKPDSFGLDTDRKLDAILQRGYRRVGTVCEIPVLLRRDDPRPITIPAYVCPEQ